MNFNQKELAHMLDMYRGQTDQLGVDIHAKLHNMIQHKDLDFNYVPELDAQAAASVATVCRVDDWMFAGQPEFGHFIIMATRFENHPTMGTRKATGHNLLRTSPVNAFSVVDSKLFAHTDNTDMQMGTPWIGELHDWPEAFSEVFPEVKEFLNACKK